VNKTIKVLHVSYSKFGGAGIAANRINKALQRAGIDSKFYYLEPFNKTLAGISWFERKLNGLQNIILSNLFKGQSLNIFPTRVLSLLNQSDADIIHLHWINAQMLSIGQIAKIKKPIVWTFHDMWPFCGSEHYTLDSRYIDGYTGQITPDKIDLSQFIFRQKQKAWKDLNLQIVTPSKWLADCVRNSVLFKNYPITVIPNCLDLDVFKPLKNKQNLRKKYGIAIDKKVILFGAFSPYDTRKGGDLLESALNLLQNKDEYVLAVFGSKTFKTSASNPEIEVHPLGSFSEEQELAELYNLVDVFVCPSRQDNLPNTCVEATACGIPVVTFSIGGIPDIIDHKKNGYLAKPFDIKDFKSGIEWVFKNNPAGIKLMESNFESIYETESDSLLCLSAREKAEKAFSMQVVAEKYIYLYKEIMKHKIQRI